LAIEPRIFLSYAHTDQEFVDRFASDLQSLGISVWIDKWELRAGDSLIERIEDGVSAVDFVIPIVSSASVNSHWVQRELEMAKRRATAEGRGLIVPVRIDDTSLPAAIEGLLYADFEDYETGLDVLLAKIYPYGIIRTKVRQIVKDAQRIGHLVPRFVETNVDEAIERKLIPATDLNFTILMWSALENWLTACSANGCANIDKWDQFELLLTLASTLYDESEDGTYSIPWKFADQRLKTVYQWNQLSYSNVRALDTSPIIRGPDKSIQFASPGVLLFLVAVSICLRLDALKPMQLQRIPMRLRRSHTPEQRFRELDRRPLVPSLTRMILDLTTLGPDRLKELLQLDVRQVGDRPIAWPRWSARYRNANLLRLLRECDDSQLRGIDLSGSDLTGTDFSGADLRGARLRGACLRDVSFVGARLDKADITAADVTNTKGLAGSQCLSVTAISDDLLGVAIGCDGGAIAIYIASERRPKIIHAHGGRVEGLFWDEDSQRLISISRGGVVEAHCLAEPRMATQTQLVFDWASAAWDKAMLWSLSPDPYYAGAAEVRDSIIHWLRKKHSRSITCGDYRAEGKMVALGTWSGLLLLLHEEQSTLEVLNMPQSDNLGRAHWDTVWRVRFGNRHPWVASSGAHGDPGIKIWDIERRGLIWSMTSGQDGPIWDFIFGREDIELFIAPQEGPLTKIVPTAPQVQTNSPSQIIEFGEQWAIDQWKRGVDVMRADSRDSPIHALALSRDGQQVASGHEDGSITLWDANTLQKIRAWQAHREAVTGLTYASADKNVVSVGLDGCACIASGDPTLTAVGSVTDRLAFGASCRGLRFGDIHTDDGARSLSKIVAHLATQCQPNPGI
jgi:WD40 repeat protein